MDCECLRLHRSNSSAYYYDVMICVIFRCFSYCGTQFFSRNIFSKLPSSFTRLYYDAFKMEYGDAKGETVLKVLEEKIAEGKFGKNKIQFKTTSKGQRVIAVVTPLMLRVHENIKHSGEILFIDSSGNVDRQGHRVFLLLTHSCAGGLPLGILVTTSESADTITEALQLYNTLLDGSAFFGRGPQSGPNIVVTDDSLAERQALSLVYPHAQLFLCIFHVLQAFWRYLWDSKNGVLKDHRQHVFSQLKSMIYAETEHDLEMLYQTVSKDEVLMRYEKVRKHMEELYSRRSLWALCYRRAVLMRDNNTNNYAESAMRILKDQIMERTKAFNLLQLLDFVTSRLESYYERRIIDICNNRFDRVQKSRFLSKSCDHTGIDPSMVIQIPESQVFLVPSAKNPSKTYVVHAEVGVCSCKVGRTGE